MGYIAKLTKGTTYIDLNAGRYKLAEDFVPPTTVVAPYISTGGIKTGDTALPRDWGFGVRVWGASSAEVKRGVDDLANFLRRAGDEAEPEYFEWKEDNNISAKPVWGQTGTRRVEIISGSVGYWESYATGTVMTRAVFVPVALTVKPWAQGSRQRLATATGGICEDWIGTTDGRSRGVMVPEADATNGNKMTNPMFGHGTWNNGWTAGADVTVARNTDPEFILFGGSSAKITGNGGAADYYTQSIAAGGGAGDNHVLSCYAKLPDSGVISATQCALYYGANAATTYTSVGNGWYRLTAAVEGIVAATITGITVEENYTVYVDAFQLEQRDYATPFFYGDMLGCHWVTTAHASATHRVAGVLSIPTSNVINAAEGCVRAVWKSNRASTTIGAEINYIFCDTSGGLLLGYDGAGNTWAGPGMFPADTFTANETIVFHLHWGPSTGTSLCKNGVEIASFAWAAWAVGANLFIGSFNDGTKQINGTVLGLTIWDHNLTAAEVLADYNNIAPLVADGQCIDPIPYLWTIGGDNFVHYEDDGIYCNVATVGGVAGDAPAKTEFKLGTAGLNAADIYIGSMDFDYRKYLDPEFLSYIPAAPPDVIDMTNVDITIATISVDDDEFELLNGRRIGVMLRANDTINNVMIKTGVNPGGAYYYTDQLATTWLVGSESNDMSPEIFIPPNEQLYRELGITRAMSIITVGKRLAAGATHYHLHSAQIVPYPLIRFVNTSASAFAVNLLYMGGKAYEVNSSALSYGYTVRGDQIELVPGRYNWLVSYLGKEGVATDTADIMEYQAVYITPRWLVA